jgi:hypothetical protein
MGEHDVRLPKTGHLVKVAFATPAELVEPLRRAGDFAPGKDAMAALPRWRGGLQNAFHQLSQCNVSGLCGRKPR